MAIIEEALWVSRKHMMGALTWSGGQRKVFEAGEDEGGFRKYSFCIPM